MEPTTEQDVSFGDPESPSTPWAAVLEVAPAEVLTFAADGRVEDVEEWAYWPGRTHSAEAETLGS